MTKLFVIRSMKTGKVLATTCFLRNAQQKSQHWPAVAKRVALGFDSHVNYIELDPAIDKQLGWLVTRLTYPAQNLWQVGRRRRRHLHLHLHPHPHRPRRPSSSPLPPPQADGTQISKPPGGATRIWVETRENMPPHDQSHVLPPEMHAYFANGTMMGRVADRARLTHGQSHSSHRSSTPLCSPPPLQTPRRGVQAARDVRRRFSVLVLGGAEGGGARCAV